MRERQEAMRKEIEEVEMEMRRQKEKGKRGRGGYLGLRDVEGDGKKKGRFPVSS